MPIDPFIRLNDVALHPAHDRGVIHAPVGLGFDADQTPERLRRRRAT
jgi:hypothetical protein